MDLSVKQRMEMVALLAKGDAEYSGMLRELRSLERKYEGVLQDLSTEQMDIVCDFLGQCETMSERMLELACMYMRFQE